MKETSKSMAEGRRGSPLRLGFVGTGWIGRMRLQSLLEAGVADPCLVCDPSPQAAASALLLSDGLRLCPSLTELLRSDIDGVVIATPSAMHAEQCLEAMAAGKAVFCQKPLARTGTETARIVEKARETDILLGVDFSYRHLAGMDELRRMLSAGELGDIFAVDLVFHNAYGPDKEWFYTVGSAGGGCLMDLGIHLVDLALWLLGGEAREVSATLFQQGARLQPPYEVVEDYATAAFRLGSTDVRLCCSWNLHVGRDAVIEAQFHGTRGGAAVRNVNGSFYDFEICRFDGTSERLIAGFPDAWGGRALIDWARRLGRGNGFDGEIDTAVQVAGILDRMYSR